MKVCPTCHQTYQDSARFCPKDSEVLVEDAESLVGSTLDSLYEVEKLLGQGGMGAVYRARHIVLVDKVAIKVLRPGMDSNEEWLRRFQREGRAARRFKHQNAVVVHDLRVSGEGVTYMVLEFVEGRNLRDELKAHGALPPEEALPVLEQVASVLDAAHAAGVVHRDLKPENVMVSRGPRGEPHVKLLDLGIAKLKGAGDTVLPVDTQLTVAGQIMGTPQYMSPEQWGEVPSDGQMEIDGRADVYSFAVMAYEMLSGHWPVRGRTIQEYRHGHVSGSLQPLHVVAPHLPYSASEVVARGMARDRDERYETAGALVADLGRALRGEAVAVDTGSTVAEPESSASLEPGQTAVIASGAAAGTVDQHDARPTSPDAGTIHGGSQAFGGSYARDGAASVGGFAQAGALPADSKAAPAQTAVEAPTGVEGSRTPSRARLLVGAVVILALAAGVAWWAFVSGAVAPFPQPGGVTGGAADGSTGAATGGPVAPPIQPAPAAPALSYSVEAGDAENPSIAPVHVTAAEPLEVGQDIRFHFTPRESGYLYILAAGERNVPSTLLTASPHPDSGVTTNRVDAGTNYVFPTGAGNWIGLEEDTLTTPFTVIFSREPLAAPAFLTSRARRTLTPAEQLELERFLEPYESAGRGAVAKPAAGEPRVEVTLPSGGAADPVVFEIQVRHVPKRR